jgi:hypothetical protein
VSIAQRRAKETGHQYTIEMRRMLNDMPVRGESEFLFKVWAEVLAIAAMQSGPQHENGRLKLRCEDGMGGRIADNRADRSRSSLKDLPQNCTTVAAHRHVHTTG